MDFLKNIMCIIVDKPKVKLQAFLVAQMVKNLPTMQEIQVWSLDQEDPLEKEMATHSSILAWRISRTEEPGRLQSMELQRPDMTEQLTFHFTSLQDQIIVTKESMQEYVR